MPLYNKAAYVKKALNSVVAQTCSDWELIVVDDGSTDESATVVTEWLQVLYHKGTIGKAVTGYRLQGDYFVHAQHPHIKVIRQPNQGVSVARNNGVAASAGNYVCFLDADDWWAPAFLEEMKKLIIGFPEAGIYAAAYYYHKNNRDEVRMNVPTGYINYFAEYAKGGAMPLGTGAVCVPRAVFDECGGFKPGIKLGEDFLLWVTIAMAHKVAFLMKPLAYYNQDVEAATRGIGRLHKPAEHMLWNLQPFRNLEQENADFKRLIDSLRVSGLRRYWLSKEYHLAAETELQKVDWNRQPAKVRNWYRTPLWLLQIHAAAMHVGSVCKQTLIRLIR